MVETCTVVAECPRRRPRPGGAVPAGARAELGVTPAIRLEPYGTLERTTFKAKRIGFRGYRPGGKLAEDPADPGRLG